LVERDDRSPVVAPVATFFTDQLLTTGQQVRLSEAAAHHARVKRLDAGDRVRLTDGQGAAAFGELAAVRKTGVDVAIERVASIPPDAAIHLRVPVGDRDRMLWLAEKATELGVTTWQAVRFRRSMSVSPRGEGPPFAEKIRARMISALEQSGGAWLPLLLPEVDVGEIALPASADRFLLDIEGSPFGDDEARAGAEPVVVFGPEGGLEPSERQALIAAGWRPSRLATSTLRFETAGIAAVAVLRAARLARTNL
jgi:16S rRNA (uracil1498-N3)-methyltransferase